LFQLTGSCKHERSVQDWNLGSLSHGQLREVGTIPEAVASTDAVERIVKNGSPCSGNMRSGEDIVRMLDCEEDKTYDV
jgi:hypothetical protein